MAEMLAVLLIFGGFVPFINAEFAASVLQDGVITGRFSDSLLLSLPPCNPFAGQSVDLECLNVNINQSKNLTNIFTVPNCINTSSPVRLDSALSKIGYHLKNLNQSTQYSLRYRIGENSSSLINTTTRTELGYNAIDEGLKGRSGAMVVITVILSLAMFFLLVCLIISTVLFSTGN